MVLEKREERSRRRRSSRRRKGRRKEKESKRRVIEAAHSNRTGESSCNIERETKRKELKKERKKERKKGLNTECRTVETRNLNRAEAEDAEVRRYFSKIAQKSTPPAK